MSWRVTSKGTGDFDNPDLWDIKLEAEPIEIDIDKLRAELAQAKGQVQRLMASFEFATRLCIHKSGGICYLLCPAQIVCNTEGLRKNNDFPPVR